MNNKVSVIIPTYKRDKSFIQRAVESVLNQTYENIELVLVDDNGGEELRQYREDVIKLTQSLSEDRVIYLQNEKKIGGSRARNEGIRVASGDFVTFLDDDDLYLPDKIKNQLNIMIAKDLDMSFTNIRLCDASGKTVDCREFASIEQYNKDYLLKYHIKRNITGTPTFMYKRDKIVEIGGFPDVKMGQEWYLMYNTIKAGLKIGYIPTCDVVAYRHDQGGISMGKNKIIGEKEVYLFKKKHFSVFSIRERMFIRFRHYAVMGVAYKRNKMMLKSIFNFIFAILCSPIDAIVESFNFAVKIYSKKGII